MARDECWLKHDSRSRLDPKMSAYLQSAGMLGYGVFWALLEVLHYQNDHEIDLETEKRGLAAQFGIVLEQFESVVKWSVDAGLLRLENGKLYQSKLKQEQANRSKTKQDIANARSEAGRKGGLKSGLIRSGVVEGPSELIPVVRSKTKQTQANEAEEKRGEEKRLNLFLETPKKVLIHLAPRVSVTPESLESLNLEFGQDSIKYHIKVCSDWLLSNGKTKKDPAAFIRNWIKKSIAERSGYYHSSNQKTPYKHLTTMSTQQRTAIEAMRVIEAEEASEAK